LCLKLSASYASIGCSCASVYPSLVLLSVVLITYNEEANLARTLQSVTPLVRNGQGEVIVVDSGSTDSTPEIAQSFGAKVFSEEWKGFSAQKNSAIAKASGDWVLSLDADEEVSDELAKGIENVLTNPPQEHKFRQGSKPIFLNACWVQRRNYFLRRWIRHGGFWPDAKLRFFRRGTAQFKDTPVHETLTVQEPAKGFPDAYGHLPGYLVHHSYPTLSGYIEHMNRYSSLGAETAAAKGHCTFSFKDVVLRPAATFIYNYFLRLGFLDGKEGLLLHLYHASYVSWKYAKAWEMSGNAHK
jgi:glycosyltransferase involved in cell wall biosynthesis